MTDQSPPASADKTSEGWYEGGDGHGYVYQYIGPIHYLCECGRYFLNRDGWMFHKGAEAARVTPPTPSGDALDAEVGALASLLGDIRIDGARQEEWWTNDEDHRLLAQVLRAECAAWAPGILAAGYLSPAQVTEHVAAAERALVEREFAQVEHSVTWYDNEDGMAVGPFAVHDANFEPWIPTAELGHIVMANQRTIITTEWTGYDVPARPDAARGEGL